MRPVAASRLAFPGVLLRSTHQRLIPLIKKLALTLAAAGAAMSASPAMAEDDFNIWGGQFIFIDLDEDGDTILRLEAPGPP